MKMHHFFVASALPEKGKVRIADDDLVHQWRHVLRFQVGHKVILLDNSGYFFEAVILLLTNREVEVEIISSQKSENIPRRVINLYMSLSKRDSFEMILEKGTELGVSIFTPVLSERSEKKSLNRERAMKIVKEAAEQSKRAMIPQINEPISFIEMLEKLSKTEKNDAGTNFFALDHRGEKFDFEKISRGDTASEVCVAIGPEGGWSEKEMSHFKENNIPVYSLGKLVLRTETAAISVLSLLLLSGH